MPVQAVTTWYLEQRSPADLRPARTPQSPLQITRAEIPSPELSRFLYTSIGGHWQWRDRLVWTYERWMQWLDRPQVQTWVMVVSGIPAGYVELEKQPGDEVEIAYFGVHKDFLGRGLGGHLLTTGIERAWDMAAKRVWVHTCSLDHPAALANYQARGMTIYKEETVRKDVPESQPGPWPGAFVVPPPPAGGG